MKPSTQDEIREALADVGLDRISKEMLQQCASLANTLHVTPKQMADCWEAYSLNKNVTELTDHSWQSFRTELRKQSDKLPNTPHDDEVADGAIAARPGLGKRQKVGSPNDQAGSLALITPPSKRVNNSSGNAKASAANKGVPVSAVDAVATTTQTPMLKPALTSTPTINMPKYEERQDAGKTVLSFNPKDLPAADSNNSNKNGPKCLLAYNHFNTNLTKPYRHLFTTLDERAKALDDHLVRMGDIMMERYNIPTAGDDPMEMTTSGGGETEHGIAPLEAVAVPNQDKICCIGRICNAAHEGRINSTSLVIEGCKALGGARVEMDVSQIKLDKNLNFSLFPGQIVAVEGMNSTGRKLTAHRICEGAAHVPQKSRVHDLMDYHHNDAYQGGMPLKMVAVCGPYTTSDNLEYEPLYDFMSTILEANPDVVIMVGPFVDMRHKDIQNGNATLAFQDGQDGISVPHEAIFANKIAVLLEEFYQTEEEKEGSSAQLHTQFVLVPSLDDATAEWVYPQAPFSDDVLGEAKFSTIPGGSDVEIGTMGLKNVEAGASKVKHEGQKKSGRNFRRVHCVSNPCTLQINELVIGVTGTDAVFHMSADETNANLVPGSRLERIAQHMLQQRSYYPLFPPAPGTNLDLKNMTKWTMPCQPDLLIVPSKLTSFARTVLGSTVVVNPGHLSKNTTGGTYAIMDIHPIQRDALESAGGDDVEMEHGVADRMRLAIKKI